jgi:hypothetical protein
MNEFPDCFVPMRYKRTTPFQTQCQFFVDNGFGEFEQCDADAEHGIYFGNSEIVKMISLCKYHTIYQESLWVGGME